MNIKDKLYVATIAEDAKIMAEKFGIGIEVNEFCTAINMEIDFEKWDKIAKANMSVAKCHIFHAPFNEILPSAIDPKIRKIGMDRLNQAFELAQSYGINQMVVHSGNIPDIYFPEWFLDRSVEFWNEFMENKPADFQIFIENQLEKEAYLLPKLCERLNHPQISLCLDIGHAIYCSDEDIYSWVDAFAPYTKHIHLHTNDKSWDLHWCLDKGCVDMESFVPYLLEKIPNSTITLENLRVEDSLLWLKERGYL